MSISAKDGYGPHTAAMEVIGGYDLRDTTALITGGNSGIGYETAHALAAAGAEVFIAVRDIADGHRAVAQLFADLPQARLHVARLDLADSASIESFASNFLSARQKLNILICNAGISYTPQVWAANGYEQRFATNHLGHFLLTTRLRPALERAAPSRVVVLSSAAHKSSPVVFEDIHYRNRPFDPFSAYGQSKTANILFAVGFTQRFAARGVVANAVMPGSILTRLQRHISRERMIQNGLLLSDGSPNPKLKSVEQGAATSVWAAIATELDGRGGLYLEDCREADLVLPGEGDLWSGYYGYARDADGAERLWQLSEQMLRTF